MTELEDFRRQVRRLRNVGLNAMLRAIAQEFGTSPTRLGNSDGGTNNSSPVAVWPPPVEQRCLSSSHAFNPGGNNV